jgi:hypothetical protein
MTTPTRYQLARAGLVHFSGWMTPDQAKTAQEVSDLNEAYAATLPKLKQGRPRKDRDE